MTSAQHENARMLAHALGLDVAGAAVLLNRRVAITSEPGGTSLARRIERLVENTVASTNADGAAVEIVIWPARPRTKAPVVWVAVEAGGAYVDTQNRPRSGDQEIRVHPALELLVAVYACAAAVRLLLAGAFSLPYRDPAYVEFESLLGEDSVYLGRRVNFGVVHLAGAGAVGTHFVRALTGFDLEGELNVVDPDVIDESNLNRCDFYGTADVGRPKVQVLVERAAPLLPHVRLIPHARRLQEMSQSGAWLERLVVAVDSRRARRALQEEMPRDVFDASTSGIEEVVLHFNSQNADGPCISCIYHEDPAENAHEVHVAQMLGVTLEDVRSAFISPAAEARIVRKHPGLRERSLVGLAYDSLFKELCSAAKLGRDDGQQVLAPLGFVSALAGALLALEFVRRCAHGSIVEPFNYWRVSPWTQPFVSVRRALPRRQGWRSPDFPDRLLM